MKKRDFLVLAPMMKMIKCKEVAALGMEEVAMEVVHNIKDGM
jgi:hypothetical protein